MGDGITSIAEGAFSSIDSLEKVSFPATLKTIGANAFYESELSVVILPEGVQTLGNGAFFSADTKYAVFIPASVNSVGNGALH